MAPGCLFKSLFDELFLLLSISLHIRLVKLLELLSFELSLFYRFLMCHFLQFASSLNGLDFIHC